MKLFKNKEILITLLVLIISFIVFLIICALIAKNGGELKIDNKITQKAYDTRGNKGGFIYYLFFIFTQFGYIYVTVIIMILTLIYTKFDRHWLCYLIAVLLAILLHMMIKDIFDRDRPKELYRWSSDLGQSFPSGHSTNATVVYGYIVYYLFKKNYNNIIKYVSLGVAILLLILIMSSRIILGMHYFTDCLGGMLLGLIILSFSILLYNILDHYNIFENPLFNFKKKEK